MNCKFCNKKLINVNSIHYVCFDCLNNCRIIYRIIRNKISFLEIENENRIKSIHIDYENNYTTTIELCGADNTEQYHNDKYLIPYIYNATPQSFDKDFEYLRLFILLK